MIGGDKAGVRTENPSIFCAPIEQSNGGTTEAVVGAKLTHDEC